MPRAPANELRQPPSATTLGNHPPQPSAATLRDEEARTLEVRYDGSVRSLKDLVDRLDEQAIPVDGCPCTRPTSTREL
jgi:hypothetical protein